MADAKTLLDVDEPDWRPMPFQHCERWTGLLQGSSGSVLPVRLVLDNYQAFGSDKFVLQLVHYGTSDFPVMRLCFGEDARHRNRMSPGAPLPAGIEPGWIYGPHFHLWEDNRHLSNGRALPDDLRFARVADQSIKSFQAGFWSFCAEAKIVCSQHQIPISLPTGRLF